MKKVSGKTADFQGKGGKAREQSVERKLVGVRIEPRLVKVMKAIAELHDCALGELIEQVVWASMEGENFFADRGKMSAETKARLESLKSVYGVDYDLEFLQGRKGK